MMKTPICDFVKEYANSDKLRMHMPGHKGKSFIGIESLDVTEITGADSLFDANGIINESEKNASNLFGGYTFYSTEGSSHVIRSMLFLAVKYAKIKGKRPVILAGRNAHKAFLSSAVVLDFDIEWLYPNKTESYLSCSVTDKDVEDAINSLKNPPCAVYITTPDYLGNTVDIKAIAKVCKKKGVLLIVDNAHGAYTAFLDKNEHSICLGADMCSNSAHKTLPALTGAAYLHVNKEADCFFKDNAKRALSLFGSTSPSYLTLQSLDKLNEYLDDGYREKLNNFIIDIENTKKKLIDLGFCLIGAEKMKITLKTKPYGYTGDELKRIIEEKGVICEFSDPDYLVLMPSVETGKDGLLRLLTVLSGIPKLKPKQEEIFDAVKPERVLTVKQAIFSDSQTVKVKDSLGRILAENTLSCPPAVSVVVAGERINENAVRIMEYYGVENLSVVKE